jgi:hypothetical protein
LEKYGEHMATAAARNATWMANWQKMDSMSGMLNTDEYGRDGLKVSRGCSKWCSSGRGSRRTHTQQPVTMIGRRNDHPPRNDLGKGEKKV